MKRAIFLIVVHIASLAAIAASSAADIAVNVDGIADWMSSAAFIDATAYFRRWGMPGAGWQENPKLKLSAENLPLGDADAVSYLRGYPEGVYTLRFEGTARVNLFGAQLMPDSIRRAGKVTTAQVLLQRRGDDLVTLQVRDVDPKDPIRGLQLLAPGYRDASQVFRTEFLRRVRPFGTIRFMDWQQTNGSPVKSWDQRAVPGMFSRTGARGVPLEEIELLANLTRRNVWVNIPLLADDEYVRKFATHLRDNLHRDAVIRVEYSNELWNFGFQHSRDNIAIAKANTRLTKPDDFGRCAQQAADRLGITARIFREVFGANAFETRVRPVLGGGIAIPYWAQTQLEWLKANYPGLVKELAVAPYFGVEGDIKDADTPGASADALFAKCNALIDSPIAGWIENHSKLAREHGMGLVAYEGGNHLTATNNVNEETKQKMQYDRRMAQTYQHLLDVWHKSGGGLFVQFGHIAPYTKFGYWGLLERPDQPGSVKWDFFMSRLLPAGDANLDGEVTWEDVKIVKENLGQAGKWWEQGDFNGDGKVDSADIKLMLPSLKGATAQQRAELQRMGNSR